MLKPLLAIDTIAIPVLGLEGVIMVGTGKAVSWSIDTTKIIAEDIASVEAEFQVDRRGTGDCCKNGISMNRHQIEDD